ncbi:MAG TPA: OB-fold domain-containing protein [Acidimicrobiia bacterium]|nr:OB-fold domain-containing protein [Acidimicrobiia bacterium]
MSDRSSNGVLPRPTELDQPHWDGLKRHELLVQRCATCGGYVWYPSEVCPGCRDTTLEWTAVEPAGTVYSFTVQHQRTGSRFDGELPYVSAVVQLRDAPEITMGARLIDVEPDAVRIGLPVTGDFLDTPEVTVLRFRPTEAPA